MLDRYDMIRDGKLLDTLDRRGDGHRFYSSFGFDRHYDRHCYHPYRSSDRVYFTYEFKKVKPPNFDGYMNKSYDAEAWLLWMNKFFELQEYTKNMKAIMTIFSLKGNADIWW